MRLHYAILSTLYMLEISHNNKNKEKEKEISLCCVWIGAINESLSLLFSFLVTYTVIFETVLTRGPFSPEQIRMY